MKEILTIEVCIKHALEVKGKSAEVVMITFDGNCDSENFKGKILPGGVDTQKEFYPEKRTLSARYMLEGVDKVGKLCHIFIENNGVANENGMVEKTVPKIITDSECLSWMENAHLSGTITSWEKGVIIHVFANESDYEKNVGKVE